MSDIEQQYVLDDKAVGTWLHSHLPGDIVGIAGDAQMCPLARYVEEIWHGEDIEVDAYSIAFTVAGDRHYIDTPRWAEFFIQEVDGNGGDDEAQVSAARARTLLDRAIEDVQATATLVDAAYVLVRFPESDSGA